MLTLTSPVETWAHRWPAGPKLALLALATTGLLLLSAPVLLAGAALATAGLYMTAGRGFARTGARLLWPLWPFVLVVGLWHLWTADLTGGAAILLRMLTAVALANFVTMTTRLSDMLAVFQGLARPLSPLLPPRRLALAFALVIRFIPVMLQRMAQIEASWRARSPRPPRWRVLVPGVLAALDDADRVAEALRARGGAG
ncbi:energy-coupling factor transporter transmembrane component T [Rhodobacter calidifons]|uniref:Energy-coupling factor transporter transmembrane protein EcfT n=1 Tax=Rhodobacter calidifons TaxID=2715277 RepID=A0ABX0G8U7_9RHOB|nr:energy-coupling factor transporter transmembrane component T [Rhodobacter calidifons]NHB77541.1 energy-coupling factor transporter transmembrane protein EcfT [Rhodobacter calidifons]